ncbi:MAG: GNAT family N-acetyltransferase [bacterium]|nr:GNAT family N-acetyltransferase [bacterium]
MNIDNYIIRRSEHESDGEKLKVLFNAVFHPEKVGELAEVFFHHLPGRQQKYWFIAEEKETSEIVSAFTLVPWTLEMEGVQLKTAELAIVGTADKHKKKGLMKVLNSEFDKTIQEEGFDLAFIQGIPGFYDQFGFNYSIGLDNFITVSFHQIKDRENENAYSFRKGDSQDIPYLMEEDAAYRKIASVSSFRDKEAWEYLFSHSLKTEYGSEYWIMESKGDTDTMEKFYFRIPAQGFGEGLIVSEISMGITVPAMEHLLAFCKKLAKERDKPSIRLGVNSGSPAGKIALAMGAEQGVEHALQVKFPNRIQFLNRIKPVLEKRIKESFFRGLTGTVKLDFYKFGIDIIWGKGRIESIAASTGDSPLTMSIRSDLFPALCLGYRSWKELRHCRADIRPLSNEAGILFDVLFPKKDSWICEQY